MGTTETKKQKKGFDEKRILSEEGATAAMIEIRERKGRRQLRVLWVWDTEKEREEGDLRTCVTIYISITKKKKGCLLGMPLRC